jgi:predicted glutamine amidotransferase
MPRLFAIIGNRSDFTRRVLAGAVEGAQVAAGERPLGWGIGMHDGGEVLLKRRPVDERASVEVRTLVSDARAEILVGQVRRPAVGANCTENTQPFRYRQWLYAQTGTLAGAESVRSELFANLPEFLKAAITGQTDGELFFATALSFLRDQSVLEFGASPTAIGDALRSTSRLCASLSEQAGETPTPMNHVVADPERVVAWVERPGAYVRAFTEARDFEECLDEVDELKRRAVDFSRLAFFVFASDFDEPPAHHAWKPVPAGSAVTLTRAGIQIER